MRWDFVNETPGGFPDRLLRSCCIALPSDPSNWDSQAI